MVNETVYLHMIYLKKYYYFIDLCYILNRSNLKGKKLLVYIVY